MPPVIHVDTDAPLHSDHDGRLTHRHNVGHLLQARLSTLAASRAGGPFYRRQASERGGGGPLRPGLTGICGGARICRDVGVGSRPLSAALLRHPASLQNRTLGGHWRLHPDSFPVFDTMRENCFVIADSNHGYKMIGVGDLVAHTICGTNRICSSPSASLATPKAIFIPCRTAPFPGADGLLDRGFAYRPGPLSNSLCVRKKVIFPARTAA